MQSTAMTQERPSGERPLSSLRRPPRIPPDYVELRSNDIESSPFFDLAEGESPFGPPLEYKEIFRDPEQVAELAEAGMHYSTSHEKNTVSIKRHIQERFDLTPGKSEVVISGQGSAGILSQSLDLLPPAPDKSTLHVIEPAFPYIASEAEIRRKAIEESTTFAELEKLRIETGIVIENVMNRRPKFDSTGYLDIIPVTTSLWASPKEALEAAKKMRKDSRKRGRKRMFYMCNPRTPHGDIASLEDIEDFAQFLEEMEDLLVIDEAYGEWDDDTNSAIRLTEPRKNVLALRTLSKGFSLAGWRIGYAVMSKEVGEIYKEVFRHNPFPISGPQIFIAERMLRPDVVRRHFDGYEKDGLYIPGVKEKTEAIKTKFLELCQENEISVKPTSPKTPIVLLSGYTGRFHSLLKQVGIATASGEGFRHPDISSQDARIMMPPDISLVPQVVEKVVRARELDRVIT